MIKIIGSENHYFTNEGSFEVINNIILSPHQHKSSVLVIVIDYDEVDVCEQRDDHSTSITK